MVGLSESRPYVLTDRSGLDMIADQFRAIVDAMPARESAVEFLGRVRGVAVGSRPPESALPD